MPSLGVVITTYNSASSLEQTLSSVSFADEIIIVDSGSTDKTAAIAHRFPALFYNHPWTGYGAQKNYGLAQAKSDWILFVDADEVIPPRLAKQIQATITAPRYPYYWLRLVTFFLHRPLRHLSGHNLRLIKRGAAAWNFATVHEQMVRLNPSALTIKLGDPDAGLLDQPVNHYSHATVRSYLAAMHRYTSLDAKQMAVTSRHRSGRAVNRNFLLPYWLAARQLFKLLVYRRGFLDGYPGIIWCLLSGYYEYEMAKKYLRLKSL